MQLYNFIKTNCLNVVDHVRNITVCSEDFPALDISPNFRKDLFSRNCLTAKSRSFFSILGVLDAKGVLGGGQAYPPTQSET